MRELVAIAFAEETLAGRAAEEVGRCSEELGLDPDAASVVVCERDGSVQLTTSRRPGGQARWSEFWSRLVDAVTSGGCPEVPIDPDFCSRLRHALQPGTSALLIASDCRPAVLEALSPLEGEPIACAFPDQDPNGGRDGDL